MSTFWSLIFTAAPIMIYGVMEQVGLHMSLQVFMIFTVNFYATLRSQITLIGVGSE